MYTKAQKIRRMGGYPSVRGVMLSEEGIFVERALKKDRSVVSKSLYRDDLAGESSPRQHPILLTS